MAKKNKTAKKRGPQTETAPKKTRGKIQIQKSEPSTAEAVEPSGGMYAFRETNWW